MHAVPSGIVGQVGDEPTIGPTATHESTESPAPPQAALARQLLS